jgi:hypothetical protein
VAWMLQSVVPFRPLRSPVSNLAGVVHEPLALVLQLGTARKNLARVLKVSIQRETKSGSGILHSCFYPADTRVRVFVCSCVRVFVCSCVHFTSPYDFETSPTTTHSGTLKSAMCLRCLGRHGASALPPLFVLRPTLRAGRCCCGLPVSDAASTILQPKGVRWRSVTAILRNTVKLSALASHQRGTVGARGTPKLRGDHEDHVAQKAIHQLDEG